MIFDMFARLQHRFGQLRRRVASLWQGRLHRARLTAVGTGTRFQPGVIFWPPHDVRIGRDCLLSQGVAASTEMGRGHLTLGDRVQVNRDVHLDMTGGLYLADDVLISAGAVLYTHDHGHDPRSLPQACPKHVGAGVWIGTRAIILPGCRNIGAGAVIAAGAVVTRDVPAGAVVAGNPARVVAHQRAVA